MSKKMNFQVSRNVSIRKAGTLIALAVVFFSSASFALDTSSSSAWAQVSNSLPDDTRWVMLQEKSNREKILWASGQNLQGQTWIVQVALPSSGPGLPMKPGIWQELDEKSQASQQIQH